MPTYEYRCKDCSHQFDIVQSFTDDALTTCPVCEGALRKVFGNVGITFKGSGFYKTDSRSASSSGTAKGGEGGSTSSDGSSGGDPSSSSSDKGSGSSSSSDTGSSSGDGSSGGAKAPAGTSS